MGVVRKVVVAGEAIEVPRGVEEDKVLDFVKKLGGEYLREVEERPVRVVVRGGVAFIVRQDAIFG